MNAREEARRMAEIMLAFADGAAVQCRQFGDDEWRDAIDPEWNWCDLEYRIKPKLREGWKIVDKDDRAVAEYTNAADARSSVDHWAHSFPFSAPFRIVHMREVTE